MSSDTSQGCVTHLVRNIQSVGFCGFTFRLYQMLSLIVVLDLRSNRNSRHPLTYLVTGVSLPLKGWSFYHHDCDQTSKPCTLYCPFCNRISMNFLFGFFKNKNHIIHKFWKFDIFFFFLNIWIIVNFWRNIKEYSYQIQIKFTKSENFTIDIYYTLAHHGANQKEQSNKSFQITL